MTCTACSSNDFRKKIYDHHQVNYRTETESKAFVDKTVPHNYIFKGLVRVCSTCGHGELETALPPQKVAEYYDRAFWGKSNLTQRVDDAIKGNFSLTHLARAKRQREFIAEYVNMADIKSILEIGAGDALLSRELQLYCAPKATFDVCEPGEHWLPYYKKNGISKVADYFPFDADKNYGLIVNSHWLEHIQNIHVTLRQLSCMLSKHGLLMIEVPNTAHSYWDLHIRDTPHIHFFTQNSLSLFAKQAGFEVVDIAEFGISFEEYCEGKKPGYEELGKREKGYSVLALLRKSSS